MTPSHNINHGRLAGVSFPPFWLFQNDSGLTRLLNRNPQRQTPIRDFGQRRGTLEQDA